jgi:hypothetical protein
VVEFGDGLFVGVSHLSLGLISASPGFASASDGLFLAVSKVNFDSDMKPFGGLIIKQGSGVEDGGFNLVKAGCVSA